jgi:hypothetical protein
MLVLPKAPDLRVWKALQLRWDVAVLGPDQERGGERGGPLYDLTLLDG